MDNKTEKENISESQFQKSINYNTIMLTIGFVGLFTVLSSVKDQIEVHIMAEISFYTLIALGLFILWEIFNMLVKSFKVIFPVFFESTNFKNAYALLWFLLFPTVLLSLLKVTFILLPALYIYFTTNK